MSGSSSTISRPGFALALGAVCGWFTHAPHEGGFQARLAVARAELGGRAAKAHAAALEHRDRRAELLDVGEHVRGEEQRAALGVQTPQHALDRDARRRVEAAHRLVEHIEAALGAEAGGEAELLRHAFGEAPHRPLERGALELELVEQARGARRVVALAGEAEHRAQELLAAQVVRRHEALGQVGENEAARRIARGRAEDFEAAGVAAAEIEEAMDERGLAGAVGADQAERLAGRDLEIDAAQRVELSVALDERADAHRSRHAECTSLMGDNITPCSNPHRLSRSRTFLLVMTRRGRCCATCRSPSRAVPWSGSWGSRAAARRPRCASSWEPIGRAPARRAWSG